MRLIDADALIEAIKYELWDWSTVDGITATTVLKQTISDIGNQPTIEPPKKKTGRWVRTGEKNCYGGTVVVCSCCDDKFVCSDVGRELYCRNCGAAMTD